MSPSVWQSCSPWHTFAEHALWPPHKYRVSGPPQGPQTLIRDVRIDAVSFPILKTNVHRCIFPIHIPRDKVICFHVLGGCFFLLEMPYRANLVLCGEYVCQAFIQNHILEEGRCLWDTTSLGTMASKLLVKYKICEVCEECNIWYNEILFVKFISNGKFDGIRL